MQISISETERLFMRARELAQEGHIVEAAECYCDAAQEGDVDSLLELICLANKDEKANLILVQARDKLLISEKTFFESISPNNVEALQHLNYLADKQDSMLAELYLGKLYEQGLGKLIQKDLKKAISSYQKASERYAEAAYRLGCIYKEAKGLVDYDRAIDYLNEASDLDFSPAQDELKDENLLFFKQVSPLCIGSSAVEMKVGERRFMLDEPVKLSQLSSTIFTNSLRSQISIDVKVKETVGNKL